MPVKCPRCQAELPDNAEFCSVRGQPIQAELIGGKYQYPNPVDSRFYFQGRYSLSGIPSQPSTPVYPISSAVPNSIVNDKHVLKRFIANFGKKKIYLTRDKMLNGDIIFYPIETGLVKEVIDSR